MVRSGHNASGRGRGRNSEDPPPSGNHENDEREESPPPEIVEEEEEAAGSTHADVSPRPRFGPDGRMEITVLDRRYVRNFINLQLIIIILFVKMLINFFFIW